MKSEFRLGFPSVFDKKYDYIKELPLHFTGPLCLA